MAKFSGDNLPRFSLLTEEQIRIIHENALAILNDYGILINHEEAMEILGDAGCIVDQNTKMVKFPRSLVLKAIEAVPEKFNLYSRDGEYYAEVGGKEGPLYFVGGCCPSILTSEGTTRPSTSHDLELITRIADILPQYGIICDTLLCTDVPDEVMDTVTVYTLLKNSRKPYSFG